MKPVLVFILAPVLGLGVGILIGYCGTAIVLKKEEVPHECDGTISCSCDEY
jgi:hypothetical protein